MNADNHEQPAQHDENVIQLGETIMSAGELDQKRRIALKAFEITVKQLEHDALKMEEGAILGNYDIQRRHELMDTARGMRITQAWLTGLMTEPKPNGEETPNA